MDKKELILGILLGAVLMYLLIHFLWRIGYYALYTAIAFIRKSDAPSRSPKALSDMESMILPRILRDFPDFDIGNAKQQVKDHLTYQYGDRKNFSINGVVLNDYRVLNGSKGALFQTAVSWQEKKPVNKRMDVLLTEDAGEAPALCPHCGALLSGKEAFCPDCGHSLKAPPRWQVTKVRES